MTGPVAPLGTREVPEVPESPEAVPVQASSSGPSGSSGTSGVPPEARMRSERLLVRLCVLSLVAGFIHAIVSPDHFAEWWGYGLFFVVAAFAQVAYGAIPLFRRMVEDVGILEGWPAGRVRAFLWAGILGNVAIIALWLVTRTVGIPFFGPEAGTVEPIRFLDARAHVKRIAVAPGKTFDSAAAARSDLVYIADGAGNGVVTVDPATCAMGRIGKDTRPTRSVAVSPPWYEEKDVTHPAGVTHPGHVVLIIPGTAQRYDFDDTVNGHAVAFRWGTLVAPNSAMLLESVSTLPATRLGRSCGRVIVRNTCQREAPSERAAPSRCGSIRKSPAVTERTM